MNVHPLGVMGKVPDHISEDMSNVWSDLLLALSEIARLDTLYPSSIPFIH